MRSIIMKMAVVKALMIGLISPVYAEDFPRAEDVATIDGIMKAYYDVVSGAKGDQRQMLRDFSLHTPDAKVTTIGEDKDGNLKFREFPISVFYKGDGPIMDSGFFESESSRVVQ